MAARIQAESAAITTEAPTENVGEINQNPFENVQAQEVVESETETSTSSDEVPAQDEEAKIELSDADKMKHAFEKRLGKATRQKKELLEQTSAQSARIEELERKLAELTSGDEEPDTSDMTEEEYISYRVKSEQERLLREQRETSAKQSEAYRAAQQVQSEWNAKIKKFGKADFSEVVSIAQEYLPDEVKQMALTSDMGPELVYTISKDLDLIERLNRMDPERRKFEVFSLEQRLKNPVSTTPATPQADRGAAPKVKPFDPQTASMKEFLEHRAKKRQQRFR